MTKGFFGAFKLNRAIAATTLLVGILAGFPATAAEALIADLVDDSSFGEQNDNLTPDASPLEGEGRKAEEAIDSSLLTPDSAAAEPDAQCPMPDAQCPMLAQITSVSELSDVQPTDWAFQALQSLIERYGVVAGYPDGTFRGNRAMTRYEFAAALNAALVRINELIAAGLREQVREEDLTTLQRLRTDFATELATLRSRIDTLEARSAEIEANQFSTTTKLTGFVSLNLDATTAAGDIRVERIDPNDSSSAAQRGADGKPIVTKVEEDPNTTLSYAAILFLTTSFTGRDSLTTSLFTGNGNSPSNAYTSAGLFNTFGAAVLDLAPLTPNDLVLAETFYSFPVNNSLQVVVAPLFFWLRYFDTNSFTSALGKGASGFNTFGSTLVQDLGRSTGAVVLWRMNEQLELRAAYTANADAANPTRGLFDSTRAFTTQLTYSPNRNINLRFLYDYSIIKPVDGQIKNRPILGIADDGFGGALEDATAHAFVFNFDWLVSPNFGLFGRYSYASTDLNPRRNDVSEGNVRAQSVQVGVAFPDLGKRGALATLSYVMPFDVLEGRKFLVSGGGDGGTQFDIEATYYYPVTSNIAIVPIFHFIGNANNFGDNPGVFAGILQTQISF